MRLRTASAAWRSDKPSANYITVVNASSPGRLGGLPTRRKEVSKQVIMIDGPKFIAHPHEHIPASYLHTRRHG